MKKLLFITIGIIISIVGVLMIFFRYPAHFALYSGMDEFTKQETIKKEKIQMYKKEFGDDYKCFRSADGVRIYTYIFHYIIPDKYIDPNNKIEYGNSLSPEYFEKILRILFKERDKKNIEIVNLYDLEDFSKKDCYPTKNIVLLTSDDGWDDNYNYLFPLAVKYNIPFNLAIISSKVSKLSSEISNFANEIEIRKMLDSGFMTLASHTVKHNDLTKISKQNAENEVCDSKRDLENMFGVKINTIIYPSGKYDDNSIRAAKSCGYSYGFSTNNKSIFSEDLKNKPFELTRIRVNRKSDLNTIFHFGDNISIIQKVEEKKPVEILPPPVAPQIQEKKNQKKKK